MWGGDKNLRINRIFTRKDRRLKAKETHEILNTLQSIEASQWLLGKKLCFAIKAIAVGWYS